MRRRSPLPRTVSVRGIKRILAALSLIAGGLFVQHNFFDYENIAVTRVYDGDTIQLVNGQKVRMIGIDTPEAHESDKLYRDVQRTGMDIEKIKSLGRQSAQVTTELVAGKTVQLEFDVQHNDKYGRLLAYVWFELPPGEVPPETYYTTVRKRKDGTEGTFVFLNATIMKAGYAQPMTIPPNVRYEALFAQLYNEARAGHRGLWAGAADALTKKKTHRKSAWKSTAGLGI